MFDDLKYEIFVLILILPAISHDFGGYCRDSLSAKKHFLIHSTSGCLFG